MKTLKFFLAVVGVATISLTFSSCQEDDNAYSLGDMWVSIATARPLTDKAFYLMLDDNTSLWPAAPVHISYQPDRPQRVQINYTLLGDNFQGYDHAIKLNRIDTILTKPLAPNLGDRNDAEYGKDPVKIADMWVGDGFLNIHFKAYFSGRVKHQVNLIHNASAANAPIKLEFRHNAQKDNGSVLTNGFVAFDLSEIDTQGKDVTLAIRVNTFEGVKEYTKTYNSGNP